MAKQILIELKADDKASAKIKKVETSVSSLGRKASKSMKPAAKSMEDMQVTLNRMGNRFRFMTIAFGALAIGAITLVKGFIEKTREMEAATLRVGVFAVSSGQDMDKAQEAALNLARTGLVSVTEASNALSNLLATGLNIDTATVLLKRMLDTAVLSKESLTDTFGRALEKSTLGIRILQERQVDAIGINFRADQVWRAYGKTIGKTTAEMSTQEKQMAIVNFLLKETERFAGGADLAMNTFGGAMSRLATTVEIMQAKIGATLIPLIGTLANVISSASRAITTLAENHAILVSIMISGVTVMVTLIAALAALGAVIPLIKTGMGAFSGSIMLLVKALGIIILKGLALTAILGTIFFLVLKVTGQWNRWTDSMKNLTKRIKDTIKAFGDQGDAIVEVSEKVKKQLKKLEKQIFITTRNYKESLAKWVKENKEAVKNITKEIKELERNYKETIDNINSDFSRAMTDSSISHSRKTEDINRELEEEISKGIWADKTRIRNLKLRLKRENEDFARQNKKLNADKDNNLKEEKTRFSEQLIKLQTELDEELAMQKKHAIAINDVRDVMVLDEIERMIRIKKERLEDFEEQRKEILKTADVQETALDKISNAAGELSFNLENMNESATRTTGKTIAAYAAGMIGIGVVIKGISAGFATLTASQAGFAAGAVGAFAKAGLAIRTFAAVLFTLPGFVGLTLASVVIALGFIYDETKNLEIELDNLNNAIIRGNKNQTEYIKHFKNLREAGKITEKEFSDRMRRLKKQNEEFTRSLDEMNRGLSITGIISGGIRGIGSFISGLWSGQEGGIVPGMPGQAVPILAHAGETIIPAGESPITININNPTVREDSDIKRIADSVEEVLSRRQYLRHFT